MSAPVRDVAPAKINLALHVRGDLPDGRRAIETVFAFCTDGDRLEAQAADEISLSVTGPFGTALFAAGLRSEYNLVTKAAHALAASAGVTQGAALTLEKRLPIASGVGGGSADAAAALRLLTSLWKIDPRHAEAVAPDLGSDVPACLLSLPVRGEGAGDRLSPVSLTDIPGTPVLLVNPGVPLSTAEVFARWDGKDRGPLGDWRHGRNDLEKPATVLVPKIASVLSWLSQRPGVTVARMSGSGATCFGLFGNEDARDRAADEVPREWWHLPMFLR